jgi:hypothetical protein
MVSRHATLNSCLDAGLRAAELPFHEGVKLLGLLYPCSSPLSGDELLVCVRRASTHARTCRDNAGSRASLRRPHRAAPPATGEMRRATVPATRVRARDLAERTPARSRRRALVRLDHAPRQARRRDVHPGSRTLSIPRLPGGLARRVSRAS